MSEEFAFAIYTGALVLIVKLAVLASGCFSIRMGYQLISAGVEGKFRFKAEWKGAKADLVSVSPGLLFVLLGCWLCAYAIYVDKPIYFEKHFKGLTPKDAGVVDPVAEEAIPDMPGIPFAQPHGNSAGARE